MQRTSVLAALFAAGASMAMVGCQARGGNPKLDANGDGILDPDEGSVRAPDVINQEAPSSPVATITGTLLDAYTGAPIAGATIKVQSAALTPARQAGATGTTGALQANEATSQADGVFFLKNNAPGFQDIEITAPGFATAKVKAEVKLPDAGGPTNNSVTNLFEIFMVQSATVGTVVDARDQDANALPVGSEVAVQYATLFRRPTSGSAPSPSGPLVPDGFVTVIGQVDGAGLVTFNTPDFGRCNGNFDTSASVFIVAGCGIDLNGDGIPDLTIAPQSFTKDELCKYGGKLPVPVQNNRHTGAFALADHNIDIGPASGDIFAPPFNPNQPIVITANGQINLAGSFVQVINAYAHDLSPGNGPGGTGDSSRQPNSLRYTNSTPTPLEQTPFPIDAFNYQPALALGPDGKVLIVPAPPGGWPLGQEFIVRALIAPEATQVGGVALQNPFVVNGSFASISPTGPITIKRMVLTRDADVNFNGGAYTRISIVLDRVVRGYGANGDVMVCSVNNMQGGAGTTDPYQSANTDTLNNARCPTKALRNRDMGALGGDGRARVRARATLPADFGLRPAMGNVIDIDIADLQPDLLGANMANLNNANGGVSVGIDTSAAPFPPFVGMTPFVPVDTISGQLIFNPMPDGVMHVGAGTTVNTFVDNAIIPPGTAVAFVVDVQNLGGSSAPTTRGGYAPAAAVTNFCFNIFQRADTDFTAAMNIQDFACP